MAACCVSLTTFQECQEWPGPGDTAGQLALTTLLTGGNTGGNRRRKLKYEGAADCYCILTSMTLFYSTNFNTYNRLFVLRPQCLTGRWIKSKCNIEYPVSITVQYFQDCEEWWEVPALWVHPDTASFARLYKCRLTEDQARKDKDELNTVLVH